MIALREGKLTMAENELKQAVLFRRPMLNSSSNWATFYVSMGKPEDLEKARAEYTQARDLATARHRNRSTSSPFC